MRIPPSTEAARSPARSTAIDRPGRISSQRSRRGRALTGFVAVAVCLLFADLAGAITISGSSSAFAPGSGRWAWDGTEFADFRATLEDPNNFGPGGTVSGDPISTVDLTEISAASLADVDIFISTWWSTADSAAHESTIVDWFMDGGDLILGQDGTTRDGIAELLGFSTLSGSVGDTTVSGDLSNGAFGTGFSYTPRGQFGHFDNATITALGGDILGVDEAGQATVVQFLPGTLGINAGSLLAFADTDVFTPFGGATYGASLNERALIGLNAFEVTAGHAVPEPGTAILLGLGLVGLGFRRSPATGGTARRA